MSKSAAAGASSLHQARRIGYRLSRVPARRRARCTGNGRGRRSWQPSLQHHTPPLRSSTLLVVPLRLSESGRSAARLPGAQPSMPAACCASQRGDTAHIMLLTSTQHEFYQQLGEEVPPPRLQSPLFPPLFASSCKSVTFACLVTDLTMSYTVSAATAAAGCGRVRRHEAACLPARTHAPVSASISTPVPAVVLASARMFTASLAWSRCRLTSSQLEDTSQRHCELAQPASRPPTHLKLSEWQSGMR